MIRGPARRLVYLAYTGVARPWPPRVAPFHYLGALRGSPLQSSVTAECRRTSTGRRCSLSASGYVLSLVRRRADVHLWSRPAALLPALVRFLIALPACRALLTWIFLLILRGRVSTLRLEELLTTT